MNTPKNSIIQIDSHRAGPALAIITGVHGNELTGPHALTEVLQNLGISNGRVYAIYANPPALKKEVRQLDKNMNRCFNADNTGDSYEDGRARKIMKILNECDAMLDLHAFNEPTGEPFVMTEPEGIEVAKIFDVGVISTNWTQAEADTTDGYMHTIGKVGLCLECGPIPKFEQYIEFAKNSIYQFLSYYEMLEEPLHPSKSTKNIIDAKYSVLSTGEPAKFAKPYKSFDNLEPGKVFCTQGKSKFIAKENECIIFPRPLAKAGSELFVVGCQQD